MSLQSLQPSSSVWATRIDLDALWARSRGDRDICIAVLDGPVDLSHRSLRHAQLTGIETIVPSEPDDGPACRHGTHIASVLFGCDPVQGIAPYCRGLIVPIFASGREGELIVCSQTDLARAILQALEGGAHVINISGGQFTATGSPDPLLEAAIRQCQQRNVLVVAAAGNDGCDCLHLPAALDTVLPVGAMDDSGMPLAISNWGAAYRLQGILAPGKDILGAVPGGGTGTKSGTSFATAIVSGTAALLLSIQLAAGAKADPQVVRRALIASATPCNISDADNIRCLAGRLNPRGALELIIRGGMQMTNLNFSTNGASLGVAPAEAPALEQIPPEPTPIAAAASPAQARLSIGAIAPSEAPAIVSSPPPLASGVIPSDCGCGGGAGGCSCGQKSGAAQIVYALGTIGYDFGTEARRDSFAQAMPGTSNPYDPAQLAAYIADNPYEAESLIWTLNLDATPIYAIIPAGPYAAVAYERLRQAFQGQLQEGVEIVSVPGLMAGKVRLLSGQVVPGLVPSVRGMFSWGTQNVIRSLIGDPPEKKSEREFYERRVSGLGNFLSRVYYDLRNLGITPEQRALNFAATNAFQASQVLESAAHGDLELDTISVRKSPICRPDSDCYDVELAFFAPQNVLTASRVYRFTVDVSDLIPVTIGATRAWSRRAGAPLSTHML
jgi:cyanobactin maturation PatA/PatG family protease